MSSGPMCLSCGIHHPAKDRCNEPSWADCFITVEEYGDEMHFLPCENPKPTCAGCPNYGVHVVKEKEAGK